MKPLPHPWRRRFAPACLVVALASLVALPSRAAEAPAPAAEAKPELKTYSPEVEKLIAELIAEAREAKEKNFVKEMEKEVERFKKEGLTDEQASKLGPATKAAAKQAAEKWQTKFESTLRNEWLKNVSGREVTSLKQWHTSLTQIAGLNARGTAGATERPEWIEACRGALPAEMFAKWRKEEDDKATSRTEAITAYLDTAEDGIRNQMRDQLDRKLTEYRGKIDFTPEQTKQLDELSDEAVKAALTAWRKSTEESLNAMAESQRASILKRGRGSFGIATEQMPWALKVFKDGLAKIIGADGQKRLDEEIKNVRERRGKALGLLFISEMDRRIALTKKQRESLIPLAERLVKTQSQLFPAENETYYSMSLSYLFAAGATAKAEELKPILDQAQLKRWQDLCSPKGRRSSFSGDDDEDDDGNRPPPKKAPAIDPEPEEVEATISDYLYQKSQAKRYTWFTTMQVKVEDLARVTHLPADKVAKLRTAGLGAADAALGAWQSRMEQTVRASINGVPPRNIPARLSSIESYVFMQIQAPEPETQAIWKNASSTLISPAERTAWDEELKARDEDRQRAIAAFLMAEFDRQTALSTAQWETIAPKLAAVIKEHSPAIQRMFSYSSENSAWYLQSYSRMIPFFGIPEADMKKILSKQQWDRWTGCNEYANAGEYWSNIQQMAGRK